MWVELLLWPVGGSVGGSGLVVDMQWNTARSHNLFLGVGLALDMGLQGGCGKSAPHPMSLSHWNNCSRCWTANIHWWPLPDNRSFWSRHSSPRPNGHRGSSWQGRFLGERCPCRSHTSLQWMFCGQKQWLSPPFLPSVPRSRQSQVLRRICLVWRRRLGQGSRSGRRSSSGSCTSRWDRFPQGTDWPWRN